MDLRQLRYFVAVAEYLSFTEAAKHLYVAQSAVSQQITELEKKVGVKLFIRNKRMVRLTNAGQVLLTEGYGLLQRADEMMARTRQAGLGLVGSLKIGFLGYTERYFLPSLIRQFRLEYPKIELHIDQYNHGTLIDKLNLGELDMGFLLAFGLNNIGGFQQKEIVNEKVAIVIHKDHPLAEKKDLTLADCANEGFVLLNREESPQGFNKTLLMCANKGFFPNIAGEPRLLSTVLLLVEAGIGIALLPKSLSFHSSKALRFIDLEGQDSEDPLIAAWKKNNPNPSIPLLSNALDQLQLHGENLPQ